MSKQFTSKIFRWLHQVNADSELPLSAAKIAVRLSGDFNEAQGGMAWPSCKTIADTIGMCEGAVYNAVRALHARGHLRVKWGKQGRGHSNQYWMLEKGQQADLFKDEKPQTAEVFDDEKPQPAEVSEPQKTSFSDPEKPHSASRKPHSTRRKPHPDEETLSISIEDPSRETHRTARESAPSGRSAGKRKKKEAAEEEESKTSAASESSANSTPSAGRQKKNQGERRGAAAGDAFERFWAVYPKRVAKEAARKAFAAAITRGVDAEILVAGAQRYAVERQGQPPRYTKHPATWLNAGCWEDEAPGAPVIDEQGNVVAFEQEEQQASSKSALDIMNEWLEENPSLRW
jgi:hypothetical protein